MNDMAIIAEELFQTFHQKSHFFSPYEWEHRTGKMCPFSSLHPLRNGK